MPDTNRRWLLATRPQGMIKDSDFELVSGPVPEPGEGELLVRVTDLSFDPTQRGWLAADTYLPAVKIGAPVRAGAVGQVIKSNHPGFKPGQMVQGTFGWQEYVVTKGMTETGPVTVVRSGVSPEHALGVFGVTGITAWFGLTDVGQPKAGDTVLVSGAAGATGSVRSGALVPTSAGATADVELVGVAGSGVELHPAVGASAIPATTTRTMYRRRVPSLEIIAVPLSVGDLPATCVASLQFNDV
jgi:NADPH-dependent curcumin reductase CurA